MYLIQHVWQLRLLLLSSSFFQLFSLYWNFAYVATDRIIVVAVDVEQVAKTGNLLDKRQSLTHAKEGGGVDSGVGPGGEVYPLSLPRCLPDADELYFCQKIVSTLKLFVGIILSLSISFCFQIACSSSLEDVAYLGPERSLAKASPSLSVFLNVIFVALCKGSTYLSSTLLHYFKSQS